jgi:hypothetical protein
MNDGYQYKKFDLPPNASGRSRDAIRDLFRPIGDDAWEVTSVSSALEFNNTGLKFFPGTLYGNPLHRWVEARRPHYGTPGPSSWEYTAMNISGMPKPVWYDHLDSCGWQEVPGEWYSYGEDRWRIFKRTDAWRNTDDGDIRNMLEYSGFNLYGTIRLPWRPDDPGWQKRLEKVVEEILDVKWRLSSEAGHNIGTWPAVEAWKSYQ